MPHRTAERVVNACKSCGGTLTHAEYVLYGLTCLGCRTAWYATDKRRAAIAAAAPWNALPLREPLTPERPTFLSAPLTDLTADDQAQVVAEARGKTEPAHCVRAFLRRILSSWPRSQGAEDVGLG
jgi:hypothetical protein